ncbi:Late secretory pathway protein-like protein [Emericellopsis cladophorae]|uniref:Late secretory pathway protein-like protein n=1 Tax=Emericellopsis cladophorae TaxID=2686198 RepID=A0A9P9Y8L9_9HYPO|nr:Late secretory pathway protein-like protein [Emericellopsis cladophorae]KAI6785093.1 Late secretory pathway protein-like protein [Emericellopsis cladophorae]
MSGEDTEFTSNGAETAPSPGDPGPALPIKPETAGFTPLVTVVGFHHARGPEVETWFGVEDGFDPAEEFKWSLLPFMALSDGAHASEEDFSYFTLLKPKTDKSPATSLFGISCTRQLDSTQLINRPDDVTRSTVQKAVVVIADNPKSFGMLRQRLGIVTHAWFDQRGFDDVDILKGLQESLAEEKSRGDLESVSEQDQFIGMSLRELIHEFRWQTLVLLKSCLLQPKMLFFGSRCDRLCMVQFALVSLIPGLMRNLQDCADPELNTYESQLSKPTSLQSSNRSSLLSFMGLPLQIFGKGSLFGPYTPLQQLDILADFGTKSYIVGSTNSLLLQQKDRYSDILINLDEDTVNITSASLRNALTLTAADRRWIDGIYHEVSETWDEANPSRPKTLQYLGSEEYIRAQFEAYILGLISSVKYHQFIVENPDTGSTTEADPAVDYGLDWVEAWSGTENYRMWNQYTDANLFAVSEPKHPCAGGLTMDDVQRRIADQVKDLHLDERFAQGREVLGRNFAVGREKATSMFNRIYSDMEYLRESQRRRAEDAARAQDAGAEQQPSSPASSTAPSSASAVPAVDLNKAQQSVQTAGARASAYMSSWASWAGEKRKTGGWGAGWGRKASGTPTSSTPTSPMEKSSVEFQPMGSNMDPAGHRQQPSFSESILSGASSSAGRPGTGQEEEDLDTGRKATTKEAQGGDEGLKNT